MNNVLTNVTKLNYMLYKMIVIHVIIVIQINLLFIKMEIIIVQTKHIAITIMTNNMKYKIKIHVYQNLKLV